MHRGAKTPKVVSFETYILYIDAVGVLFLGHHKGALY